MKLINKTAPPPSFVKYSKTKTGVAFEDMDDDVKDKLKDALLNEQGWICGYCQQKIKDKSKMKIEHHCEQSICNGKNGKQDKRLDYTNLMAVCLGATGNILHCDSLKSKFNIGTGLPIDFSPWNAAHTAGIAYHSSGRIDSVNGTHTNEMQNILGLNVHFLKERRRNIWMKIFSLCSDGSGGIKRDKMKRLTQPYLKKSGSTYETAFPGLYEYMSTKYC